MIAYDGLCFETKPELFSPEHIDKGTLALLSVFVLPEHGRVLDLGCGYGFVGISVARVAGGERVVMSDCSETAVAMARLNAEKNGYPDCMVCRSDAYEGLGELRFAAILSNPPYHSDFSVARRFIEEGWRRLEPDGFFYMVTKRRDWYKNKLISVFGGVTITEKDGYFVFAAQKRPRQKRQEKPQQHLSKKLQRKQERKQHAGTEGVGQGTETRVDGASGCADRMQSRE